MEFFKQYKMAGLILSCFKKSKNETKNFFLSFWKLAVFEFLDIRHEVFHFSVLEYNTYNTFCREFDGAPFEKKTICEHWKEKTVIVKIWMESELRLRPLF